MSMVTSTQKFNWLRQRLTGSKTEMPLVNKIIEFVMYESPIDIEKLRRSLHHQVRLFRMSLVVRKPVFGVSDQVRHKPGCTATEDG